MSKLWYYLVDQQQYGPVTPGELKCLVATQKLAPTDLVWTDGMLDWREVQTIRGLFANRPSSQNRHGPTSKNEPPRPTPPSSVGPEPEYIPSVNSALNKNTRGAKHSPEISERAQVASAMTRPRAFKPFILVAVVFALLGLLSLAALTVVFLVFTFREGLRNKEMYRETRLKIHNLDAALDAYANDHNGKYPEDLEKLVANPGNDKDWSGPYLKGWIPVDAWLQDFIYESVTERSRERPRLYSPGPDRMPNTEDDIDSLR